MIIAPMNMCTWPSAAKSSAALPAASQSASASALKLATSWSEPAMAPITANAPTTAPRSPYTIRPPVAAIRIGQQVVDRRADHGRDLRVGQPPDLDEERGEEAPGDEGAGCWA